MWPFQHEQNNSELWNLFPELLNWFFCLFFTHFGVELVAFAKTTFSGQGAVPTSTQSHPRLSLMPLQLSHLTDWKLLSFSKFRKLLHTVNYHHLSPKAELVRGHPVIQSYTSLILWHIHLSIVRLNLFSSLNYRIGVSALLGSPLLQWHIAGQVWWLKRCDSHEWRKGEKPHTEVSPVQLCVGILIYITSKGYFPLWSNLGCCMIGTFSWRDGWVVRAWDSDTDVIGLEFKLHLGC